MDINRILTVAETLEQEDAGSFSMNCWTHTAEPTTAPRSKYADHLRHIHDRIPQNAPHTPAAVTRAAQDCGAVACIARWTVIRFGTPGRLDAYYRGDVQGYATELLGINNRQALQLFTPKLQAHPCDITPADAADTLRRFATTGEVDWETAGFPAWQ